MSAWEPPPGQEWTQEWTEPESPRYQPPPYPDAAYTERPPYEPHASYETTRPYEPPPAYDAPRYTDGRFDDGYGGAYSGGEYETEYEKAPGPYHAQYPGSYDSPGFEPDPEEQPFGGAPADARNSFGQPLEPERPELTQLMSPAPLSPEPAPEPAEPSPPPPKGRAGRNLPAAIGVGVVLGGLVVASLYLYRVAFVGVAVVAIVLAVWELSTALASRGIRPPVVPIAVGAVAMLVGAYAGGGEALAVAGALTVLGIMVWRMPEGVDGYVRDATAGVFAALYVPFLAGFAMLMLVPADGHRRVTEFMLLVVCSDVGGYAAGVLFGRHPMAPVISPKKTWEGLVGSALACMAGGALTLPPLLDGTPVEGLLIGGAAVLTATFGDLAESVIKRDLGIKDMGSLLPGHGGIMDRLDSLLPTAPVVWLLLSILVPAT